MTEPLTAAQIIKMIHPDLPPATAHFLLNEAKPLLELIEAQAREIERLRNQNNTVARAALDAEEELAAIKAQEPVGYVKETEVRNGHGRSVLSVFLLAGTNVFAAPIAPAQPVNAELVHGFNRDDLDAVADGLEAGYESAVNTGEGSVESTTAYAARFIRAALANVKAAPVTIVERYALRPRWVTSSSAQQEQKGGAL